MIGAAIVAAVTVVVVVAASTAGAAAAAGGAALASRDKEKPPKQTPPKKNVPSHLLPEPVLHTTQLSFEEAGISFDGTYTSYSDILQTRCELVPLSPYHPVELFPVHPNPPWPTVKPPSFLDVQPHYSPPSQHFDFLNPIPPPFGPKIKEEIPEAVPTEKGPIMKEEPRMPGFLETIRKCVAEHPDLFNPDSFCITPKQFPELSSIFSTLGKRTPELGM